MKRAKTGDSFNILIGDYYEALVIRKYGFSRRTRQTLMEQNSEDLHMYEI